MRLRTNVKNVKLHYALLHALKYTAHKIYIKSNLFDDNEDTGTSTSESSQSEVVSTSDTDE